MKACVDKELCIGCGLCTALNPEVFTFDDDGKAIAITSELEGSNIEGAKDAQDQCPVGAINVD
jgi:ferredoxin